MVVLILKTFGELTSMVGEDAESRKSMPSPKPGRISIPSPINWTSITTSHSISDLLKSFGEHPLVEIC
jgi:hypothetical protein